jgi:hypothetical protein
MAPQRLEKIESAPGNGMGSEDSNLQDLVHGARLIVRDSGSGAARTTSLQKVQKKAPNVLKSFDAELK